MRVFRYRLHRLFVGLTVGAALVGPVIPAHAVPPNTGKPATGSPKPADNPIDAELAEAMRTAPTPAEWPNSNYARLLDLGNVTIKPDGTVVARYRLTYKLFNSRERDRLGEVNLAYNASYQSVHVVSARTIKKDGTVINVDPNDIRTTSPFSDFQLYDDTESVSFSMPALEDECLIDYTWEETTRPLVMPGQFTNYWGFSGVEPVGISRLVMHVPADKPLKYKIYNDDALKPTLTTSLDGKTKTYTWERSHLNPVEVEPAMPSSPEVFSWLEVSSLNSWQDIAKWFWDLQQPQAKPSDAIRKTVAQLTAGKKTDEEKARAIYNWVADRTRYVALLFGISAYKPHLASDVHDKLYGDCKDKANLLITMLGLAGIKAYPVLLNREDHQKVDQGLPRLEAFDHCIAFAEIGGKEVWLDATQELCAYGDIPYDERGSCALVIRDGKGEFKTIPTFSPDQNSTDVSTHVALQPDGSAHLDMTLTLNGALAQEMREAARSRTPDQRKEMVQLMAQKFSTGATLKDFSLPDGKDKEGVFVIKMTLQAPNFAKKSGKLLIMPLEIGSDTESQSNPYVKETRVWPIVEDENSQTHTVTTITLPDGFTLEDAPSDVNLAGPLQEFHRAFVKSSDGKTVTTTSSVVSHSGRTPATDYAKVRGYYADLLKTTDEQLVLKKAN
ncbi:MAG TPA: DUF3857 and transglutaminase domain-containing protein [Chthonomonadaceae bacterium]|nr:DUF3857 and transglutaminase domain-containing protein [Chthonomonadaceae bacterium]